ncbi:MAG: Rmf/CrpP family protein [Pseudomonadota bacterium]|nr:Rmf/CrpP family protein [Pseudomonadota bacterium]
MIAARTPCHDNHDRACEHAVYAASHGIPRDRCPYPPGDERRATWLGTYDAWVKEFAPRGDRK